MFVVFTLNTMGAKQTKHDTDNLQRASWDFHQIIKSNIYIYISIETQSFMLLAQQSSA